MSRGISKHSPGRIIAVGGGKGGVGKSVLSTNLAVALGRAGQRVIIVDGDLGAPNLHTLFGVSPGSGLQAFFDHGIESLAQAELSQVATNVSLISGAWGTGTANINHGQKQRLLNHLRGLDTDIVLIDLGAGTAFNVLDLFLLADIRLLVMAPELTSMQNGYTFLKDAVHRLHQQLADNADPAADGVRQLQHFGLAMVGNLLHDDRDARALLSMSRMIRDYLALSAPVVAAVRHSVALREAANARRPLLMDTVSGSVPGQLQRLAHAILDVDVAALRRGRIGRLADGSNTVLTVRSGH